MGAALWLGLAAALAALALYALLVNARLAAVPPAAAACSPTRFAPAAVVAARDRLLAAPRAPALPPATARRYIVVGGAGFLPGWIVLQLLARGEPPARIRIVDIRPPTRRDLAAGPAAAVAFVQADVGDPAAVAAAFAAPWPGADDSPLTVFHSAANIRFWERARSLLPLSDRVNVHGTQNVLAAARAAGASVLIYTSSASVALRRPGLWLWPWQRYPARFVQILDDHAALPAVHAEFFSNYAASKARGERLVRDADRTRTARGGVLRTGCIRPGNGVYGPGGDILAGSYLVRKVNPTSVKNMIQSFVYVENCALAHLLYEQRLLEMDQAGHPDIGGQAFTVTDPNPPMAYSDVYTVLSTLTAGETKFPDMPPVVMLALAHAVEAYYLLRLAHPLLARILPAIQGEAVAFQPSTLSLTQVHLVFDDSRARKAPKDGGLGYKAPWTSLDGLCKLVIEWERDGKNVQHKRLLEGGHSGDAPAQKALLN